MTENPAPAPRPRPVPRPPSTTPVPRPPAAASRRDPAPGPAVADPTAVDAAEEARALTFGRIDDDGTVWVRDGDADRAVGQFPGVPADEALALAVRRYLDLQARVALFEARLTATDLGAKEIDATLARLGEELAEPPVVGDLDALRARFRALQEAAAIRRAQVEAERAAVRERAVAERTVLVEEAEKIAGTDAQRMQWRPAGERLRVLLDAWKEAQRSGPRLDRTTEESLWRRFSHARTSFDRERRHFFAELESSNAQARAVKQQIVEEAERAASGTDWAAGSATFRDLMARWKAAGHASRTEDDALWNRFRTAQDTFFAARDAANEAIDAEYRANLAVKENLLAEAERLVPVTDLPAARAALRGIQDRWDAAGKVPRADIQRMEARLRAVEQAVRAAEDRAWHRANPQTRARAEGVAAQLQQVIAALEADLAAAEAVGDARRATEARSALEARRSWLEQVERAARDAQG